MSTAARTSRPRPRPALERPLFRLAHLSDIHFGKIAHPHVVPNLVDEINAGSDGQPFDLVVVSGDLTQRAREREYAPAVEMVRAFRPPALVVPGNHDVPPWWRPFERVFDAGGPFREYFGEDPTPSFEKDGLAVFGLNSAHGLTIKGGKIREPDLVEMRQFFADQPPGTFKVLTVHHHLKRLRALGPHDVARGAKATLEMAGAGGVELILCGHLHISYVAHVEIDVELGHRLVIASAGTATSSRGRMSNRNVNFYNHISVYPERFVVEERRFEPEAGVFLQERATVFDRVPQPVTALS